MTAWKNIVAFLTFLLLIIGSSSVTTPAFAASIQTDIFTQLHVSSLGQATVTHTIDLTNTDPTQFVSEYAFKINSGEATDIQVFNNGQPIESENLNIIGDDRQTTVGISLPDHVVGEGQKNTIQISYLSHDLVIATPQTLSVYLPKLANPDSIASHKAEVIYPATFGSKIVSTPPAKNVQTQEDTIRVELENVVESGLQLVVGKNQFYSLNLTLPLTNSSTTPQTYQLAIPPDTNHQQVYYESFEPKPDLIAVDSDGNWIATYYLGPSETKNITAQIQVNKSVDELNPINLPAIKQQTKETSIWESNSGALAKEFNQNSAEEIYEHLVAAVEFNFEEEELDQLKNPTSTNQILTKLTNLKTTEIVNLLVAALRHKGIPAKQVVGFAYSPNSELRPSIDPTNLHSWTSLYVDGWQMADPVWENTTGGVNYFNMNTPHHLVYGFHGVSSQAPLIAGTKTDAFDSTIEVTFAERFPDIQPDLDINVQTNKFLGVPIPGWYNLIISNDSGRAYYHLPISNQSPSEINIKLDQRDIPVILPYQDQIVPIVVTHDSLSSPLPTTVQLQVNDQTYQLQLAAGPRFVHFFALNRSLLGGFVAFGIVTSLATGSLLVLRRK